MNVYYPNRKLSMQCASTYPGDTHNIVSLANVALANLQIGDSVVIYRDKPMSVVKVNEKCIAFMDKEGKEHRYMVDGKQWEQLVRDVGGAILASCHGVECGDLVKALQRDPAYATDQNGIHCLIDVPASA